MKNALQSTKSSPSIPSRVVLQDLLGFFYPIHYRIGMELENRMCQSMCQSRLSRQQVAVLWLIESEAGLHGWVRRKLIEQSLRDWFESKNSHVTMLLRELSAPPLSLVLQKTNPESGREKIVALTDAGRDYVERMIEAGLDYFSELLPHMANAELRAGMRFLQKAFGPPTGCRP